MPVRLPPIARSLPPPAARSQRHWSPPGRYQPHIEPRLRVRRLPRCVPRHHPRPKCTHGRMRLPRHKPPEPRKADLWHHRSNTRPHPRAGLRENKGRSSHQCSNGRRAQNRQADRKPGLPRPREPHQKLVRNLGLQRRREAPRRLVRSLGMLRRRIRLRHRRKNARKLKAWDVTGYRGVEWFDVRAPVRFRNSDLKEAARVCGDSTRQEGQAGRPVSLPDDSAAPRSSSTAIRSRPQK